eukprot:UN27251
MPFYDMEVLYRLTKFVLIENWLFQCTWLSLKFCLFILY